MKQTNNWEEVDKRFDEKLGKLYKDECWEFDKKKVLNHLHQELTNLLKTVAEERDKIPLGKYVYCDNCAKATPIKYDQLDKTLNSIGYGYFIECSVCNKFSILVYTSLNKKKKIEDKENTGRLTGVNKNLLKIVGENPWFWTHSKEKTVKMINNLLNESEVNLLKTVAEAMPHKVGYIQHMSNKRAYDEGNGWDNCRSQIISNISEKYPEFKNYIKK